MESRSNQHKEVAVLAGALMHQQVEATPQERQCGETMQPLFSGNPLHLPRQEIYKEIEISSLAPLRHLGMFVL